MAGGAAVLRLVAGRAVCNGLGNGMGGQQGRNREGAHGIVKLTVVQKVDGIKNQLPRVGGVVVEGARFLDEQRVVESRQES